MKKKKNKLEEWIDSERSREKEEMREYFERTEESLLWDLRRTLVRLIQITGDKRTQE